LDLHEFKDPFKYNPNYNAISKNVPSVKMILTEREKKEMVKEQEEKKRNRILKLVHSNTESGDKKNKLLLQIEDENSNSRNISPQSRNPELPIITKVPKQKDRSITVENNVAKTNLYMKNNHAMRFSKYLARKINFNERNNDNRISYLTDFADSSECFPGVNIAGGVCYFLWDKDYFGNCTICNASKGNYVTVQRNLSEFPVFVRSNLAINIIRKIRKVDSKMISELVYPSNPFGFRTYVRGEEKPFSGSTRILTSEGVGYVKRTDVTKSIDAIDAYNVIMTRAMSGGNKPGSDGKYQIVPSTMRVMEKNEICAETYICIGSFKERIEADNLRKYLSTIFARFLMLQAMSSIMINKDAFQFVPLQDFSKPWTDEELYKKYDLTDEEIAFIESMIRPME
jgi:site-specific DNA-methyltransferase (adenine-specific)